MGALQGLRRDLYETIRRARPKAIEDLSPHWRGQTIGLAGSRLQIPVWAVGAFAGVLLLAVYLFLRHLLSGQAEALALKMAALYPDTEIQLAREAAVKPPPTPKQDIAPQLVCIKRALATEILAGKVSAEQTPSTIFVRVGSVVLFPSGGSNANRRFCADRQQDRRRARQAAGRDRRHRLHRRRPDQDPRVPLQLRTVAGAREIGGGTC